MRLLLLNEKFIVAVKTTNETVGMRGSWGTFPWVTLNDYKTLFKSSNHELRISDSFSELLMAETTLEVTKMTLKIYEYYISDKNSKDKNFT